MIRKASIMVLGFFVLGCSVFTAAANTESIGSKFNGFYLKDVKGNAYSYQSLKGRKGTAVVFLSKRCPIVKRYRLKIDYIARAYEARGIRFVGIHSSPDDSEQNYKFKTLVDERGVLANQLDARFAPEIFVFDEIDKLIYRGAIDDDYSGRGAKNKYLADTFNKLLTKQRIVKSKTRAFGCSIKRVANNPNLYAKKVAPKKLPNYSAKQPVQTQSKKSDLNRSQKSFGNNVVAKNVVKPNFENSNSLQNNPAKRTRVSGFVARRQQQDLDDGEITQQLANPISPLLRLPIQVDYNDRVGISEESLLQIDVEPVVPIRLGDKLNLISRTRIPTIRERDVLLDNGDDDNVAGFSDIEQTFIFTPSKAETGGLSWGFGPVFLLNTSTDGRFGRRKWGVGPAGSVVLQNDVWTAGLLANHIESFAGDDDRPDVSDTYANPFFSRIFNEKTTIALNSESIYDWEIDDWTVPINLTLSQLLKIGNTPFQIGGGPRYWATAPAGGPRGWGFRVQGTFVFPR